MLELVSVLLGPFFVWRAALTLSYQTAYPEDDEEKREQAKKNLLYQRVLTVIEALLESLPQFSLQSVLYCLHPEDINPYIFMFSATCSLAGLTLAGFNYYNNREAIQKILGPPPSLVAWGARTLDPAKLEEERAAARARQGDRPPMTNESIMQAVEEFKAESADFKSPNAEAKWGRVSDWDVSQVRDFSHVFN